MRDMTGLPRRAGIGLKPDHHQPLVGRGRGSTPFFLEVHPQNFFHAGGPAMRWLERFAADWPLSFHSVALSLGRAEGVDAEQLDMLTVLVERFQPAAVSDHLAWCSTPHERMPDLLPLPMTRDVLDHVAGEVGRVQDRLKRIILIENPSRMLAFAHDEMDEPAFLNALARRTGCGILLDINNIEVSATNLGLDPWAYLSAIDMAAVGEIHLAGHAIEEHADGPLLIDDHGAPASELTWRLYARALSLGGPRPTLVEWDTNVPPLDVLLAEAEKADRLLAAAAILEETADVAA